MPDPILPATTLPSPGHRKSLANVLTALLAVVIAALTLFPAVQPPGGFAMQDKLYHTIAFAGLLLPSATLYPRALIWAVPFGLLLGGGIELIQPWVGRTGDWIDFVADTIGIVIGVGAGLWAHQFWRDYSKRS